jgi:hypothetical protein
MIIDITQKELSLHYEYEIFKDGELRFRARAKRTVWPFFRKISIENISGEEIASLSQQSLLFKITEKILPFGCPYVVTERGRDLGWIREWFKTGQPHAKALLHNDEFMIYGHSGNRYSVYRGPAQIGLIQRKAEKNWDGDRYHAEFDHDTDPLLNAIHVLFTDITWHTEDTALQAKSYETNITFSGVKEDTGWKPKAG